MGIKSDLQAVALRKAYEFVDRDPETNIPKLVYFLDKFIPPGILNEQIDAVKKVISETESNWYKYIMSLWTDIDDDVRKKIFENFVINASFFSFILGESLL